jgi:adenosylhomocysteine nucleosidase
MRIGIIAALPGELRLLVKDWTREKTAAPKTKKWRRQQGSDLLIAACAGMGADAARRAFAEAEREDPLDMLLSVGWVGALTSVIPAGTVHVPSEIIDSLTGERFLVANSNNPLRLVTTPHVADAKEKARLASTYSALLVDMEAATLARLAAMRGIPFAAIRGVSDTADDTLPDITPHIDPTGNLRLPSFLASVAFKPRTWAALIHLGRNSSRAAQGMRDLIVDFLKEKDVNHFIRRGSR